MAIRFQENFSLIGSTISRYRVLERLGGGGAGVVYKAEDLKLERLVALKFLSTYRSANEADKRRFLREARASSAVDHPNICTVYEIDETRGRPAVHRHGLLRGGDAQATGSSAAPLPLAEAVRDRRRRSPPASPPPTPRGSSTATSSRPTSSWRPTAG